MAPEGSAPEGSAPEGAAPEAADPAEEALVRALGHGFRDPDLLRLALTHGSLPQGRGPAVATYDRLEFLGDRVLALLVTELLYARYPDADAGELARRLNALVRQESLAAVAEGVPLGPYIAMSADMRAGGGAQSPAILSDVCEAVIAALYLDGGLEAARRFVLARFEPLLARQPTNAKDAKTQLQEWAAARGHPLPVYDDRREGPDHAPVFEVTVRIPGVPRSEAAGSGRSKRAAQQEAAAAALQRLEQ